MASTSKIPAGFSTLTPNLVVSDGVKAIDLYIKAFGAKEEARMMCGDTGKIMHACLQIGSSKIFINNALPACAATASNFYVYVDDVDAAIIMAKSAGMQETIPVEDMFWGDRVGCVKDAFGNNWTLATHTRDVSPQEMEEGGKKFAEKCSA